MSVTAVLIAAVPSGGGGVEREIPSLIASAGPVVKGIIVVLFLLSIVSWAIVFQKARAFGRARRRFRDAELIVRNLPSLHEAGMAFVRLRGTPWGSLLAAAYAERYGENLPGEAFPTEGTDRMRDDDLDERVARAVDRAAADQRDLYENQLLLLATVANVSPFLGLFGTVWGIMSAFVAIGVKGSASIASVGPGIAEALLVTAFGLAAAIPASIAYNHFVGRLRALEGDLERFSGILVDKVRFGERVTNETKRLPVNR
jgi:biopolymer transport protein TolQ